MLDIADFRAKVFSRFQQGSHHGENGTEQPVAILPATKKPGKTSISRYLNGEKHLLSDDLLARIEKAIAELNYRPSLMARGLAVARTRLIGLIIADITNPYSVNVLSGIEAACREKGLSLLVCNTNGRLDPGAALSTCCAAAG